MSSLALLVCVTFITFVLFFKMPVNPAYAVLGPPRPLPPKQAERYNALLRAHEARGERLVTERLKFAEIDDRLEEAGGGLSAEAADRIAELENAVFTAQAAEAEARYELERLRNEPERDG